MQNFIFNNSKSLISEELFSAVKNYIENKYIEENFFLEVPAFFKKESFEEDPFQESKEAFNLNELSPRDIEKNLDETFQEMLFRMIDEKKLNEVQTYKHANITKQHFSKIKSNRFYQPKKETVYAFAIAMELSLEETKELLKTAGFAMSHSYVSDIIMEYFLINKKYDIFEINNTLFEFKQNTLGKFE